MTYKKPFSDENKRNNNNNDNNNNNINNPRGNLLWGDVSVDHFTRNNFLVTYCNIYLQCVL